MSVQHYFEQGLASSTRKTYLAGQRRFLTFCNSIAEPALPASEDTLQMFVCRLAREGLAHQTIKVYLSGIRNMHVSAGLHEEFAKQMTPKMELVLRGIKKEAAKSLPQRQRLPITTEIMVAIKKVLVKDSSSHSNVMLWAACGLAFFGFLRCGEFTVPSQSEFDEGAHLTINDVALDSISSPSLLQVTIKQSKTDPFRKGVNLFLAKTGKELCPVAAMLPFLALRGSKPGPLFILRDGSYLTRKKFTDLLRSTLREAGLDDSKYAAHSFRIGAATSAKEAGIDDVHVKMLGRWKSDAYQLYIRTPQQKLASLTKQLVSGLDTR